MDWELLWKMVGRIANVLGILNIMVSIALWLSFGQFKRAIEQQKIKYVKEQEVILQTLQSAYNAVFIEDNKSDDVISQLRKQFYSINRNFQRLLVKEDLKCVQKTIKILGNNIDKIDFPELRKNLDFIITTFAERSYDYE